MHIPHPFSWTCPCISCDYIGQGKLHAVKRKDLKPGTLFVYAPHRPSDGFNIRIVVDADHDAYPETPTTPRWYSMPELMTTTCEPKP